MDADSPVTRPTGALDQLPAAAGQAQLDLHVLRAGQAADRATIRALEEDIATCRAELAAARGEAAGLLAATTMTECACATLRQELVNTARAAAAAEAALQRLRDAPVAPPPVPPVPHRTDETAEHRIAQLHEELRAVQALAAAAAARVHAIGRSTSWRLTAPLRVAMRLLRGGS